MPCIFCIAVFAMLAGAVTTAVLDEIESRLNTVAAAPVVRAVDSGSVAKYELDARGPGGRPVPVAVTVYKRHKRVRIQVMTHDISRPDAEALEDWIARVLGLEVKERSDAHDEEKVRAAFGPEASAEADETAEAEAARTREAERRPR